MTSARLSRLAETVNGEALLCQGDSEIKRLLLSAWGALDEAARIAEERERRERTGEPQELERQ